MGSRVDEKDNPSKFNARSGNSYYKCSAQEIIAIYNHISEVENRFNNIELSYRKLASHWLLVALGAIGYLITIKYEGGEIDWLLIFFIGLAASVGVAIIWYLDSHVYHRLLDAAYLAGKKLEDDYVFLPRIRNEMSFKKKYHHYSAVSKYYFTSCILLLTISTLASYNLLKNRLEIANCALLIILITFEVIGLIVLYYMMKEKFDSINDCGTNSTSKYRSQNVFLK